MRDQPASNIFGEFMSDPSILKKNETYPEPVVFEDHYSIMLIAFQHGVNWGSLGHASRRADYARHLIDLGWRPHDYLFQDTKTDDVGPKREWVSRYQPERIMTPHAHEVLYGETLFSGDVNDASTISEFIANRLNPDIGSIGMSESLMFSLKPLRASERAECIEALKWLDTPLTAVDSSGRTPVTYEFNINWVDLILYNDGSGILAFKVNSSAGINDIHQISLLNRTLRDFKNTKLKVHKTDGADEALSFWNDLVFKSWLGLDKPIHETSFTRKLLGKSQDTNGLLLRAVKCPAETFDRFQRYCKTFTFAQMPNLSEGEKAMLWGRPLADPAIYYSDTQYHAMSNGEWDNTLNASQKAIHAGYATVRDMVVFELATVSDGQASLGWEQQDGTRSRGWQYCLEYIRKVVSNNFVEIWEYWAAIGLRDTFVFVSYDHSMPVSWQAESYYYPLYAMAYHSRYQLDTLSQGIIDYDMADAVQGRQMRDEFQRFRNQYWFQEVTVDFQGVEVFKQMKNGMGLNEQYETVSSEISDVSDHLQEKWDRGTRWFVAVLALLFAPIIDLWNTWLIPFVKHDPVVAIPQLLGGLIPLFLISAFVWFKFREPLMAFNRRATRKFHRIVGIVGNN